MKSLLAHLLSLMAALMLVAHALAAEANIPDGDNTYQSGNQTAVAGDNKIKVDVTGTTATTYKVVKNGAVVQSGTLESAAGTFTIVLDAPLAAGDVVSVRGTTPSTTGPFAATIVLSKS